MTLPDRQTDLMCVQDEIRATREKGLYRPVVVIVIRDEVGQILLVQSARNPDHWSPPQGGIGDGEDIVQAVYREIMEEVAIRADQLGSLVYLGSEELDTEPERTERRGFSRGKQYFCFAARYSGPMKITLNTDELTGYVWAPADRIAGALATTRPAKRGLIERFIKRVVA